MDSSMNNIPGFLAEALMVLDEDRNLVSPTMQRGSVLANDNATELIRESQTMPPEISSLVNGFPLATQTEVSFTFTTTASYDSVV